MGKMRAHVNVIRSPKSAFLGDSQFPKSAERFLKGGRIRLYEEVYQRYSRLAFTHMTDRSVAISGLEKRLIRTFNTVGEYGILEQHLSRSLLWQRGINEMMQAIQYPPSRQVPSWSWMAYTGRIAYLEIPFGKVEWFGDIQSPFSRSPLGNNSSGRRKEDAAPPLEIKALARDLSLQSVEQESKSVFFDTHDMSGFTELKCVVIARDKLPASSNKRTCYILIIAPQLLREAQGPYKRVGVGALEEDQIGFGKSTIDVRIR